MTRPAIAAALLCLASSCVNLNGPLLRSAESMRPLHAELLRYQAADPAMTPEDRAAYVRRVEAHHAYLAELRRIEAEQ